MSVKLDQLVLMEDGHVRIEGLHIMGRDNTEVSAALSLIMDQLSPVTTHVMAAAERGELDTTQASGHNATDPGDPPLPPV